MTKPKTSNLDPNTMLLGLTALVAIMVAGVPWLAMLAADKVTGSGRTTSRNPFAATLDVMTGNTDWTQADTIALAIVIGGIISIVSGAVVLRKSGTKTRVDSASRALASSRELRGITPRDVETSAKRLRPGALLSSADDHGILIGRTLRDHIDLRMDWESCGLGLAGPRVGKSTSLITPAVAHTTVPVVVSSNKPDVHDDTRLPREKLGTVWLFDPQGIVGEEHATASWWVNLLATITSAKKADKLAQHFESAAGVSKSGSESYFTNDAHNFLSSLIVAAAAGGGDLMHVYEWSYDPDSPVPVALLRQGGYHAKATQLKGIVNLTDRQRDGVIGTARSWLSVLDDDNYAAWVLPPVRKQFTLHDGGVHISEGPPLRPGLTEFKPSEFVTSAGDTLYALSKEGADAATALTTALVGAVFDAGEKAAEKSAGRRLTTPLVFMLDEVANCVRLKDLPDKYSHYGSRGMPTFSILQSWAQGVTVWGQEGMEKLWSASNVVWYGGGDKEDKFLGMLSQLIGEQEVFRVTTSSSRGGGSRSVSSQRERILSPAELAALPRGRALIMSSGNRPVLARTVPWMEREKAAEIRQSKAIWEPGGK